VLQEFYYASHRVTFKTKPSLADVNQLVCRDYRVCFLATLTTLFQQHTKEKSTGHLHVCTSVTFGGKQPMHFSDLRRDVNLMRRPQECYMLLYAGVGMLGGGWVWPRCTCLEWRCWGKFRSWEHRNM